MRHVISYLYNNPIEYEIPGLDSSTPKMNFRQYGDRIKTRFSIVNMVYKDVARNIIKSFNVNFQNN